MQYELDISQEANFWSALEAKRGVVILLLSLCLFLSLVFALLTEKGFIKLNFSSVSSSGDSSSVAVNKLESLSESKIPEPRQPGYVVELAGAVAKPGVYEVSASARVVDLLAFGGGLRTDADAVWVRKNLNKAQKLQDGVKIYIPFTWEQVAALPSTSASSVSSVSGSTTVSGLGDTPGKSSLVNVNTAASAELDSLPGIGPAYAARIIGARPYKDFEELVKKSKIARSILEKIKTNLTY